MKPRHAAALALAGWFLMVPPIADRAYDISQVRVIEGDAPLSNWVIKRAYDSAEECEKVREELRNRSVPIVLKQALFNHKDANSAERIQTIDNVQNGIAECIANDDPRLNPK